MKHYLSGILFSMAAGAAAVGGLMGYAAWKLTQGNDA